MTDATSLPHAVLMGDIVQSERALSARALHAAFNAAIDAQNAAHAGALASPLTITLGDEFQGLTRSLSSALPILRALRFGLKQDGVDCRFVLGVVQLQTAVNPERAWNMMGPGLARAREKLQLKTPVTLYRFSLPEAAGTETLLEAIGAGMTAIETGWTDRQRQDIEALLSGLTPKELAARRGVGVHSIYKVRSSGSYDAYEMQWKALESTLAALDMQLGMTP
ncbi:SatD family protein [Oceanicola sp. S124]|uniref:SatD family protein n=1 Tax=Oceanicola sp. S124 TaxID=1042378 RepID=UPI000255939E|nr:SatD family protein [Oceanicola sp. S124]